MRLLKERCAIDHVILAVVVEQPTIHHTEIEWQADSVLSDREVIGMIAYAHELGLKVILKPMLNVSDGMWRAHINFFDHDVPCEPKWSDWFASYTDFISHYAALAEETKCEMLVIGCELVNSDRREQQWRDCAAVRKEYRGGITYNVLSIRRIMSHGGTRSMSSHLPAIIQSMEVGTGVAADRAGGRKIQQAIFLL